jgi:DNA-binding CsgD family transcriptional regulator
MACRLGRRAPDVRAVEKRPETTNPLTPRERECLLRLAQGERVDRIADRLSLSNATVELHLANARRRLGARTSPEAVAKAVLNGWIVP